METNESNSTQSGLNPEQLQADMATIKNVLSETDKNREIHRIVIAAGNFFCGILMLIAVPFLILAVGIVGVATPEVAPGEPSPTLIVGTVMFFVIVVVALLSLPFLLAGWGVWQKKSWGTIMALIAGILNLTNLPLGTALGIYTIWAAAKGKLNH